MGGWFMAGCRGSRWAGESTAGKRQASRARARPAGKRRRQRQSRVGLRSARGGERLESALLQAGTCWTLTGRLERSRFGPLAGGGLLGGWRISSARASRAGDQRETSSCFFGALSLSLSSLLVFSSVSLGLFASSSASSSSSCWRFSSSSPSRKFDFFSFPGLVT